MDFNGILGFAGLVLAAYSILDTARRRELEYRMGWLDWFLAALCVVAVHYLLLYNTFENVGLLSKWKYPVDAQTIAYVVVLAAALVIYFRFSRFSLTQGRIAHFQRFVDEVLAEGDFNSLAPAISENIATLDRIARGEFPLRKIHRNIVRERHILETLEGNTRPWWTRFVRPVAKLLPDGEEVETIARGIRTRVLSNRPFALWASKAKPYVVLDIMVLGPWEAESFLENFFGAQISDPSSMLCNELRNTRSTFGDRYQIDEGNRLLRSFLVDATVAQKHSIWKPIGEELHSMLNRLRHADNDPYNSTVTDVEEWERDCPLTNGIHFFDVMVREAIFQGIRWHMWLYYLPSFTKKICRNVSLNGRDIDLNAETPTRYCSILNQIKYVLRGWIRLLEGIPVVQQNVVLDNIRADHSNGNPIKSAMIALADHTRTVMMTDALPEQFRFSSAQTAFSLYVDVHQMRREDYAQVLLNAVIAGGTYRRRDDHDYSARLIAAALDWDDLIFGEEHPRRLLAGLVRDFVGNYDINLLQLAAPFERRDGSIRFIRPGGGRIDVNIVDRPSGH